LAVFAGFCLFSPVFAITSYRKLRLKLKRYNLG